MRLLAVHLQWQCCCMFQCQALSGVYACKMAVVLPAPMSVQMINSGYTQSHAP